MKLSKRIALIFILATLVSIALFFSFTNSSIKESYSSEITRMTGICNGTINQFRCEVDSVYGSLTLYKELIQEKLNLVKKGISGRDNDLFKLKSKFLNDGISYKVILSKNFEVIDIVPDRENLEYNQEDIINIINKIPEKDREFYGAAKYILFNNKTYLVLCESVNDTNEDVGYLLILKELSNTFINEFCDKNKKNVKVFKNYIKKTSDTEIVSNKGVKIIIDSRENEIFAYIKLDTINLGSDESIYLRVKEPRKVKEGYIENIRQYQKILIIFSILLNIVLFIIIQKLVVKRILKINETVDEIIETNDLCKRVTVSNINDEINDLSLDINNMLENVQDVNMTLQEYSKEMSYLANYDTLTSMLNRHSLYKILNEFNKENIDFCIFFIDLDNFKNINDTLGHDIGDEFLKLTATILNEFAEREVNIKVARLGGDEFVVVKFGDINNYKINKLGKIIVNLLNQSYKKNNLFHKIRASIGISKCPQHTRDINTLFQYADIAMYKSKIMGGNNYCVFSESMLEDVLLEGKLKDGIRNGEIIAYFQPIIDIMTNKIVGAEALARWVREDGIITPNTFIPIAKKNGDIIKIDYMILRQACEFCKKVIEITNTNFQVSVNISNRCLKRESVLEDVKEILNEFSLNPQSLRLEITEDEIIEDIEYANKFINNAKEMGISVSLDDFGVGYSSFNYIKTLQVDTIKFDRSLCMYIENCGKTLGIIKTLIDLCHSLDLRVLCEGIELKEQIELLKTLNCDYVQGFYISKPMDERKFIEFMN